MTYTKKTTENLQRLAALSDERNGITPDMYTEHTVFRGLRDMNGNGVVTGLTEISTIKAKEKAPDGSIHTCPGELYYRGYNICDLVGGFSSENRFGFEEIVYLLLFSSLPDKKELQRFEKMLAEFCSLPKSFVRDMIMKAPGRDVMNILSRCVLALYTYDDEPDNISTENVLRQCLHLIALLNREAFDHAGLIYGIGHAVYSESDPRAGLLMDCAASLAAEKGYEEEYALYSLVARLAPEIIAKKRKMYKGVSANVDFYSGLIYRMLDLPCELYTPIFAMARIAGWSAHRLEELQNAGKIIRPAYIGVKPTQEYVPIEDR